jgi:outer membrane protein TolC
VGKSIALEQFDAAVKMFQARLTLQEAIYKYRLAQARLIFASGEI